MDNEQILAATAPENLVIAIYGVVDKDIEKGWAIVALGWRNGKGEEEPRLGIRYFSTEQSTDFPKTANRERAWLILPEELHMGILCGLRLKTVVYYNVLKFLSGDQSGDQLHEALS